MNSGCEMKWERFNFTRNVLNVEKVLRNSLQLIFVHIVGRDLSQNTRYQTNYFLIIEVKIMSKKTDEKTPNICAKCGRPISRVPLIGIGATPDVEMYTHYLGEDWAKKKLCNACSIHCLECGAKLERQTLLCGRCSAIFREHKTGTMSDKFNMWTCEYCKNVNKKEDTICSICGAIRKATNK